MDTMTLTGRALLDSHRDAMTAYMMLQFGTDPREAALAIGQLWARWVARCAKDTGRTPASAEDAVTAALEFLTSARHIPGALADDGWHTMLGYTREYAALCHALTGRFIHHCPSDIAGLPRKGDCSNNCDCADSKAEGGCHDDDGCTGLTAGLPVRADPSGSRVAR